MRFGVARALQGLQCGGTGALSPRGPSCDLLGCGEHRCSLHFLLRYRQDLHFIARILAPILALLLGQQLHLLTRKRLLLVHRLRLVDRGLLHLNLGLLAPLQQFLLFPHLRAQKALPLRLLFQLLTLQLLLLLELPLQLQLLLLDFLMQQLLLMPLLHLLLQFANPHLFLGLLRLRRHGQDCKQEWKLFHCFQCKFGKLACRFARCFALTLAP